MSILIHLFSSVGSFRFLTLHPSTTPIWQVQGLWMQQRSSSHDSNGLLGSLADQGWTAGMAKNSLPLSPSIHPSKSLSPSSLTVSISLSPAPSPAHSGDKPQVCPCPFHLKSPRAKSKGGVGKDFSVVLCVSVDERGERKLLLAVPLRMLSGHQPISLTSTHQQVQPGGPGVVMQ